MIDLKIVDNKSGAVYVCLGVVWKMGIRVLFFMKDSTLPGPNYMQFTYDYYLKLILRNEIEKI